MKRRSLPTIPKEEEVKNVDAILCADLHVRADVPLCRTDDFQSEMFRKLDFIFNLSRRYSAPLLCGGDIGHRSQWPNWLIEKFMELAQGVKIVSALGQHDLPGHNLDELNRSACGVLQRAGVVSFNGNEYEPVADWMVSDHYIHVRHFGEELQGFGELNKNILLTHRMVIEGVQDWPGQVAEKGHALLRQLPFCQLILSGDNHQPFVVKSPDGRLLVNPGSMMRTTAAQINHMPRVYLWDAVASQVSPVYLPIEEGVIDRNHIDVAAHRGERLQALIERVKMDYEEGVSFEDDLQSYFSVNRTWDKTIKKVWQACELEGK